MKPETDILLLKKDLKEISKDLKEVKELIRSCDATYLKKEAFEYEKKEVDRRISNLERLVFGAVAIALSSLAKSVIDLVTQVRAMQ
jgi:two-component SAPR family response regulator